MLKTTKIMFDMQLTDEIIEKNLLSFKGRFNIFKDMRKIKWFCVCEITNGVFDATLWPLEINLSISGA